MLWICKYLPPWEEKPWEVMGRDTLQGSARQLCLSNRADSRDQSSSEAVVTPMHYLPLLSSPAEMGWWAQGQHDSADFLELIPRLCHPPWRCWAVCVPVTALVHTAGLVHFWKWYLQCCLSQRHPMSTSLLFLVMLMLAGRNSSNGCFLPALLLACPGLILAAVPFRFETCDHAHALGMSVWMVAGAAGGCPLISPWGVMENLAFASMLAMAD